MTNAKNALRENSDLRGSELRQAARRMVAGVGEYAPTVISRKKSNLTLAAEPEVATTSTSNSNNILDEVVVDHNPEYSSLLNHQTTAPSNDATNTTQNVDFNYVPNFGSVTTFDN